MQTKTYFANNVPAALEVARQELGPDAMILNSRPAPEDYRHLGKLEVVFAWDPPPVMERQPMVRGFVSDQEVPAVSELDEIRQQLSALRVALNHPAELTGKPVETEEDRRQGLLAARLSEAGFSSSFARDLAREVILAASRPEANPRQIPDEKMTLQRELARRIPAAPLTELKAGETRTMAFIGPPGRGKTNSLVKLAIRLGLSRRVPVRIYGAGVHQVGAPEQLARYAAILGVPQQSFESLENLNLAMTGDGWRGLILIDTPGLSPADQPEMRAFSTFFASRPEIEKHLVLRACERTGDLFHSLERFSVLQPTRLLFTGLDEASTLGGLIEVLMQSTIACMFAGTGPRIPDDMYDMDMVSLARRFCESLDAIPAAKPNARAAGAGA